MLLKPNHCPNCGVFLSRVSIGIPGSACAMFHVHPGVANLVVRVVNGEHPDLKTKIVDKAVVTETEGDEVYTSVDDAVIAVLDNMHDVIFPDD